MTTKNNFATSLERAFVELIASRVKDRGWKKGEFAATVWPGDTPKAAAARWTAMRSKASNTGKPQGVQISDAQLMAEVLGVSAYAYGRYAFLNLATPALTVVLGIVAGRKKRRYTC